MLLKTSEPSRQIERMLEKSARRRRWTHRQDCTRDASQAVATAVSAVSDVMQVMTTTSRILHHAKPHPVPIKPVLSLPASRISRDAHSVTRWNVFRDMFL